MSPGLPGDLPWHAAAAAVDDRIKRVRALHPVALQVLQPQRGIPPAAARPGRGSAGATGRRPACAAAQPSERGGSLCSGTTVWARRQPVEQRTHPSRRSRHINAGWERAHRWPRMPGQPLTAQCCRRQCDSRRSSSQTRWPRHQPGRLGRQAGWLPPPGCKPTVPPPPPHRCAAGLQPPLPPADWALQNRCRMPSQAAHAV